MIPTGPVTPPPPYTNGFPVSTSRLQAFPAGGDYVDYLPQRVASSHVPGSLPQPPLRTTSGVPIQCDYDARVQEQPEPEDHILASMDRQRAVIERMCRKQEVALQEQYDEIARIDATASLQRARCAVGAGVGEPHEEEDEMPRRTMAGSEARGRSGERPVHQPQRMKIRTPATKVGGGPL
ncbi:hypothetical protein LXA43DRAFT_1099917 [Ganoderma leucocontextum]|nr:hypothetical protein LXA43DRAFT_1099917 [Ganoderma leucocontextum]